MQVKIQKTTAFHRKSPSAPKNSSSCCCYYSYGLLSSILEIYLTHKNTSKIWKRANYQNNIGLENIVGRSFITHLLWSS